MPDDAPLFDAGLFSTQLKAAMAARGVGLRELGRASGVSPASVSRILQGWPQASHENVLRLRRWMDPNSEPSAAA